MTSITVVCVLESASPRADLVPPMRRGLGRPTPQAALQLREFFLETALDTFLAHGYAGASVNAIARAAGVSKATVYRVFGDKQQIFRIAAEYGCEWAFNSLKSVIDPDDTPEQVLWKVIWEKQGAMLQPRALATVRLIVAEAGRFPEMAALQWASHRYLLSPLSDYLKQQVEKGTFSIDDPQFAALQITTLASGGLRPLLAKALTPAEQESWARSVFDLFLKSWTHRGSNSCQQ